jgi:hypothetical protein
MLCTYYYTLPLRLQITLLRSFFAALLCLFLYGQERKVFTFHDWIPIKKMKVHFLGHSSHLMGGCDASFYFDYIVHIDRV